MFNANGNAVLGSGVANVTGQTNYAVTTGSSATADTKTGVNVAYNTNNTPGLTDDTATVSVQNGGQAAGPTTYKFGQGTENPNPAPTGDYAAFYRFDPTAAGPSESILYAGAGADSFAGFVAANDPTLANASHAAFNGAAFFGGTAPTNLPTANATVTYNGNSAAGMETGSSSGVETGAATITANFSTGAVGGTLAQGGPAVVGFTGAMDTGHATYSAMTGVNSEGVTINSTAAYGQVNGGFFGAGGYQTAGNFDVQNAANGIGALTNASNVKITGAFGATTP